jgi:hypothetical protein
MNPRRLVTAALLAFVGVSFGWIAFRDASEPTPAAEHRAADTVAASTGPGKIIAYYFHVTVRCSTCRNIEAYSKEAIQRRFPHELSTGQLEWRPVNVQLPENRHFIRDYGLFTKSLVLVREANGRQQEYKILNDTWELVGDKPAMQSYVEREVRDYLRKL